MIKIDRGQMSSWLRQNLPRGFFLTRYKDHFVLCYREREILCFSSLFSISAEQIVEIAKDYLANYM